MKRLILMLSLTLALMGAAGAEFQEKLFRKQCGEKAAAAGESMVIEGRDGWLLLASELRHVSVGEFWGEAAQEVSKATKPDWRDPLAAIVDFKEGLEQAGIELLLVPVPPKVVVYPEMLDDASEADGKQRIDSVHQEFLALLKGKGVAVLDLYPAFSDARSDEAGVVYCKQDSHWSGRGCQIAASRIAETLKDREWMAEAKKGSFVSEMRETEIEGDLWSALKGDKPPKEKLPLRFVEGEGGGPIAPDMASPVILLGDSHTLVFHAGDDMHARGAGLPDQLAVELGFPVDLIGVRGSGATPARINLFRRTRSDADYLKGKKLVIWCFTAREFTEAASGWRKVPVTK